MHRLLLAALAACSVSSVSAAPVVIEFAGTVSIAMGRYAAVPVGAAFSGRIGFDLARTDVLTTVPVPGQISGGASSTVICGFSTPAPVPGAPAPADPNRNCGGAQPGDNSALTLLSVRTDFGQQLTRQSDPGQPVAEGLLLASYREDASRVPPDGADFWAVGISQGIGHSAWAGAPDQGMARAILLSLQGLLGWLSQPDDAQSLPDLAGVQDAAFVVQETWWDLADPGSLVPRDAWGGALSCLRYLGDGPAVCDVGAVAEVSEPGGLVLMGFGLAALAARRRRC